MPKSPKWTLSFRFAHQNSVGISLLHQLTTCPTHLITLTVSIDLRLSLPPPSTQNFTQRSFRWLSQLVSGNIWNWILIMWWQFPSLYTKMELGLSVTLQLQHYNYSVDFAHNIHLFGLHVHCLLHFSGLINACLYYGCESRNHRLKLGIADWRWGITDWRWGSQTEGGDNRLKVGDRRLKVGITDWRSGS